MSTPPEPDAGGLTDATWHHACTCGIAAGWSLIVEHADDCPFGKQLAARVATAKAEAWAEGVLWALSTSWHREWDEDGKVVKATTYGANVGNPYRTGGAS